MNAAQDMALLGMEVSVMTRIGDDDDGELAHRHFQKLGLDTSHCIAVPGAHTMSACVTIETDSQTRCCLMHKDLVMFEYDVAAHVAKAVSSVAAGSYDAIYTDGYHLDLVMPVVKAALQRGVLVMADIEVLDEGTRRLADLVPELIAPATIVSELSGHADPGKAALALANSPGRTVIATAGAGGSYGAKHGDTQVTFVPAHSGCKVLDTVGAGDAYHAGYLAALKHGHVNLKDRMIFATRVAAALCETHGPVVSLQSLERYGVVFRKSF